MLQIGGVKGEAELGLCEPLTIPHRRDSITRLSRRLKNRAFL